MGNDVNRRAPSDGIEWNAQFVCRSPPAVSRPMYDPMKFDYAKRVGLCMCMSHLPHSGVPPLPMELANGT